MSARVVVIGSGMGGLAAAVELAAAGMDVTVLERAGRPGGKLAVIDTLAGPIDCGPTVFTLKPIFEALFASGGARLDDHVRLVPVDVLARHAWPDGKRLDLLADPLETADEIGRFAGPGESGRFLDFCRAARHVFDTLDQPYLNADGASLAGLLRRAGLSGLPDLIALRPFTSLWKALGGYFQDPRLRQLFARYATYCGSSPFAAPATLMLVAHVERLGVFAVEGGMSTIARAVADLAQRCGARFRFAAEATQIIVAHGRATGVRLADGDVLPADIVVHNGDIAALGAGLLGPAAAPAAPAMPRLTRSLSAVTWAIAGEVSGFPLVRHSVFFSSDYGREFEDLFHHRRLPTEPTVYVCAQDRARDRDPGGPERLLVLVNAPADGDLRPLEPQEIARCKTATFAHLKRLGLTVTAAESRITTPADFARRFPATGGALYGRATHGWSSAFRRPGPRTSIPGLYLAGGSAHPGPGLPMAALSGRLAALSAIRDWTSTTRSHRAAMPGGTSTA